MLVRRTLTIVQVPCTLTTVMVRRTLNTVRVPCTVTNVLVRRTLTIVPLHCTPTFVPVRCTLTAVPVNWKIAPVINTTPDGGLVRGTLTKLLPVFQLPGALKPGHFVFCRSMHELRQLASLPAIYNNSAARTVTSSLHLFGHLKEVFGCQHFSRDDKVKLAVLGWFRHTEKSFYFQASKALITCRDECLQVA